MLALFVKVNSDDIASTEDPQIFRGFQIFCRSADYCLLYSASRTLPLITFCVGHTCNKQMTVNKWPFVIVNI